METFLFTSESVNEGHPDKLCDQISDAVLDACLEQDPDSKVACETCTKTNMVMVFGEITTKAKVDYEKIVRDTCRNIGFVSDDVGLDADNCKVLVCIEQQSPDIAQGVHGHLTKRPEDIGAGDQGHMFGYATDETPELMPLSHVLATKLGARLTEVRKNGTCPWLRPDGKTQVTVEYQNDKGAMVPVRVHTVLISTQHDETVTNDEIAADLKEHVIKPVVPEKYLDLYIYTMGERSYALEMAKLLDPEKVYFSSRVIAQDDSTQRHQKGLDVVLGQESAVLILDDTEPVWGKHKENLILMERYHFFASSCRQFGFNCKSLSQLKSDESETDGALASILKVLKQIHRIFFDSEPGIDLADRDVREVLKTVRKEVLKECKIVFSRVFPTKFQAENHHLWKMAEQLGAICVTETDPSVTHVVSADTGTEKSRWAVREKKFLVHPGWIEAANYFWEKQPEEKFAVK